MHKTKNLPHKPATKRGRKLGERGAKHQQKTIAPHQDTKKKKKNYDQVKTSRRRGSASTQIPQITNEENTKKIPSSLSRFQPLKLFIKKRNIEVTLWMVFQVSYNY